MGDPLPNIEGLCRLCLSEGENKSVFERNENHPEAAIVVMIKDFVSIKINKDDRLPKVICNDCEGFINTCYLFKEKCDTSQITLNKLLGIKEKPNQVNTESNESMNKSNSSGHQDGNASVVTIDDSESVDISDESANNSLAAVLQNNSVNPSQPPPFPASQPSSDNNIRDNSLDMGAINEKTDLENIKKINDVISSVTSSNNNINNNKVGTSLTVDNQSSSSCHAIKIASTVSLANVDFDKIGEKCNNNNNSNSKSSDIIDQTTANVKNNDDKQNNRNNVNNHTEATSNEPIVPNSTITSSKQQEANVIKLITNIKKEPLDESEMAAENEVTGGGCSSDKIRVKTEPEELVDEHVVQQNSDEQVDLANNKCTICNYVFSSNNSLMRHLQTRKHIRRTLPPEQAEKLELSRIEPVNNEDILPDNAVRSTRQKTKVYNNLESSYNEDSQETFADDSFFCKICNRTYCSASELKRHSRSMKHMRNLSIKAALKRKAARQFGQDQHYRMMDTLYGEPPIMPGQYSQKDFICPMENCNFACKEGSILLEHMMVHGIRNNVEKPLNPLDSMDSMNSAIMRESFAQSLQKIYCKCKQVFTNNSEYLYHLKLCRYMAKVPAAAPPNMPSPLYDPNPPQPPAPAPVPPPQQVQLQSQPSSNKLNCRLCDITFTSNEVYLNHMKIYHKGSTLEQNVPKTKPVLSSGKLWTQFVSKSGEILYNCIICNKKFKQHFSLNSHLRHHKQQPSLRRDICRICTKVFSNSKLFEKHVRGHFLPPNSRKLFCMKCYKTFDHRGEVIAHRATCNAMKMKLYSCSVCKHSFKDMVALKEHKLRAHTTSILPVQALCTVDIKEESGSINPPAGVPDANKTCHLCNKSFYNFQNMKRHCQTVHRTEDLSFLNYGPFAGYDEPTTSALVAAAAAAPPPAPLPSVTESQIDQDKWDCEFCRKQFRSEKLLIYHIEHHCPYLQHIPNNLAMQQKKPVERHKRRCIICARFLPASQSEQDTVCVACLAKFEGNQLEVQKFRKPSTGNQPAKVYSPAMNATTSSTTFQTTPRKPVDDSNWPPQLRGKFFQCPYGRKLFTTEAWMLKHSKNCDGQCPAYYNCAKCNLNFKSPSMFEKHIPKCEAGTIKRFDCSICGKTYSKRDYVLKHKRFAHRRGPQLDFDADYDDWIAPLSIDRLINNRNIQQMQMEQQQQQSFHEPEVLMKQELIENDETGEDQADVELLDSSLEIVQSDDGIVPNDNSTSKEDGSTKTYPCEGCSRVFNSYNGLIKHSVVHTKTNNGKLQFDCKFCQRTNLLQSQIYSHTYRCIKYLLAKEPSVSCQLCNRNFNTSQQVKEFSANLISHVFQCYDIPYYKNEDDGGKNPKLLCYICCYAFSNPDKLRFHKAEHARRSQAKSYSKKVKRKLIRTDIDGGDGSIILDDGTQHITTDTAHTFEPPRKIFRDAKLFKCKVCERQFFSMNKLKNHEKVHGIIKKTVFNDEPTAVNQPTPDS